MGERYVIENTDRYLVCRAGWMMGAGPEKDKKFIQKIMRQIKEGSQELFIVDDKAGTPTYTHDFAKNVKILLEHEYWGLYNMVCKGRTSRLEVAREMILMLGLESKIRITPVNSAHFEHILYAERPASERLVNRKLELRGLNTMPDWKSALRRYLQDYYSGYLTN
jgi:dTDP-4-dehydrorhamnose reductase